MKSLLRSSSLQKAVSILLIVLALLWFVNRFTSFLPQAITDILPWLNLVGILFIVAALYDNAINSRGMGK